MALIDRIRGKSGDQAAQEEADKQTAAETDKIWDFARTTRRRREFEWFLNNQIYDNNQFFKYNRALGRVQPSNTEADDDRVTINITYQQVRGGVNFLNAEHPTVGVRAGVQADDAYLRAKKEQHLCDYWYDHLEMNEKGKLISTDACKNGLGWAKILFDQDALAPTKPYVGMDGQAKTYEYGEVMFERCDPYEIYPDPLAKDKKSMKYIIQAIPRTIAELQNNPNYRSTDKLASDQKLAASILKQAELRIQMAGGTSLKTGPTINGMETLIILEIFRKVWDPEKNKWKIRITTRTETGIILRDEDWGMDEFPFEYFQTDVAGLVMDSKGMIHNIREPNQALNDVMSIMQESAKIMGRINWSMPRGSNVNVIDDTTGQFIEFDVNPGGPPKQTTPSQLPQYMMQLPGMYVNFMQDIGGMHNSFNGNAPFAQASGDLVDTLSSGDQNNLTQMRDNYDDFFRRCFKLMLKTAQMNYKNSKNFPTTKQDVFGQYQWIEIKPDEISTSDDLTVSTGTAMPYSIAEKQQMYMNLWKEKVITDPDALLKLLEMPDIDNAMGDEEQDIQRQLDEIQDMIGGKDPKDPKNMLEPLISEDHAVHIKTVDKFVKGDRFKKLKPQIQQNILDHRADHVTLSIQLAQISANMQYEPIKRSITVMERFNKMSDTTAIERTQFLSKFGVQSDAAQIQQRGGLYVEDPAQAEVQAQNEDIEMSQERAVQVSFTDNHQVHIETHLDFMSQPQFLLFPEFVQTLFKDHMNDHLTAIQALQVAPGLMPNDQMSQPNPPHLNTPPVVSNQDMSKAALTQQGKQPKMAPKGQPPTMQSQQAPITKPVSRVGQPTNKLKGASNGKRKS